jgi:NAD(P)-dependent dehydrogenase (short-subunit alcohol dehydrogenase family)
MPWNDIQLRKHYNSLWAYKRSKLANVLFIRELDRRLGQDSTVRAFAADPGLVNTDIGLKGTDGITRWIWSARQQKGAAVEAGAATSVFLASEPSVQNSRELYWKDCRSRLSSRYSRRPEHAERLWKMSERMCGIDSADYGL